jgi:enamine deaminase RidA (YjgF/YER057c/UK114 family)
MAKTTFHPDGWPSPPGYSHAVRAGGPLIFVSGQVPLDASGRVVGPQDFDAQVVKTFENLGAVLAAAGSSFERVVRLGYFVVDLDGAKLHALRRLRGRFLPPSDPPASTLIGVHRLFDPDVLIEIEAVAEVSS